MCQKVVDEVSEVKISFAEDSHEELVMINRSQIEYEEIQRKATIYNIEEVKGQNIT